MFKTGSNFKLFYQFVCKANGAKTGQLPVRRREYLARDL